MEIALKTNLYTLNTMVILNNKENKKITATQHRIQEIHSTEKKKKISARPGMIYKIYKSMVYSVL